VRGYDAVIFRRTNPQISNPGALWDKSQEIYSHLPGGVPIRSPYRWSWPAYGTSVGFYHLQHDDTVYEWQGTELPYIGFDELTHFSSQQFWYMLSRNRSLTGIRPRIRATTNPDADSWVKQFLAPWVDDRYQYPAESGEIRWFYREDDTLYWLPPNTRPPRHIDLAQLKSCTFISASLFDNPTLLDKDPGYLANLKALPLVERRRLLDRDWSIRPSGNMFRRTWFSVVDKAPDNLEATYRFWDNAGTEEPTKSDEKGDPDYTASVKLGFSPREGRFYVLDVVNERLSPKGVDDIMLSVMRQDGIAVSQYEEQEGGWSGKHVGSMHQALFAQFDYHLIRPMVNKIVRAKPFSSAMEGGLISLVRAPWNEPYINQLCAFPKTDVHDDMVDASSGAYNQLARDVGIEGYVANATANALREQTVTAPQDLLSSPYLDEDLDPVTLFSAVTRARGGRSVPGALGFTEPPPGEPLVSVQDGQDGTERETESLARVLSLLGRFETER
jgi:predicted phage terminase large subunit-like protein